MKSPLKNPLIYLVKNVNIFIFVCFSIKITNTHVDFLFNTKLHPYRKMWQTSFSKRRFHTYVCE